MPDIATPQYARELVAIYAAKLRNAIHAVQAHETNDNVIHRLAEVCAECAWCQRKYGEEKR